MSATQSRGVPADIWYDLYSLQVAFVDDRLRARFDGMLILSVGL
jgi:hypothetical protein